MNLEIRNKPIPVYLYMHMATKDLCFALYYMNEGFRDYQLNNVRGVNFRVKFLAFQKLPKNFPACAFELLTLE